MSDYIKGRRLNEAFLYVNDEYLELVELERKSDIKNKKSYRKVIGTVAACICILFLPIGVFAAHWFGIRELILPKENDDIIQEIDTPNSDETRLSLSGYMGSPEANALAEWNSFLEEYDTDHAVLNGIGNTTLNGSQKDWSFYGIYTQEMEEKLNEIVTKFGLKLHTECNVINQEELMNRVGGCFIDKESLTWAYMYEDGYFHVEGNVNLLGLEAVDFQLVRCVKGTFNDVVLCIDEEEEYLEWQYATSCGEPVLLALAPEKALIFADYEGCFISVNVLCGSESGMTKESLQEFSDMIDFSILREVQVPEMSGDSTAMLTDVPPTLELMRGKVGKLGNGVLVFTIPQDDKKDYRLYFFADENEKKYKIENADFVFPDVRAGNIPIGTFQTFEVFQIGDIGADGTQDILLVGIYGQGEELFYDARVYKESQEGYIIDDELTQSWNEKYNDENE